MMKHTKTTIALAAVCLGIGLAPAANAAFATTHLDTLRTFVTTALTDTTAYTDQQVRALESADAALAKETKTVAQDLKVLSTTANTLKRAFEDDIVVSNETEVALAGFVAQAVDARAEVDATLSLYEGDVPKNIANQLAQADEALAQAQDPENTFAERTKSVGFALNKLRVAQMQATKLVKAPETMDGKRVLLVVKAPGEKPAKVTLDAGGTYTDGEETGTWSYARVSANAGTLTITPDGGASRVLDLTFKSSTKGTFVGGAGAEDLTGVFSVQTAE